MAMNLLRAKIIRIKKMIREANALAGKETTDLPETPVKVSFEYTAPSKPGRARKPLREDDLKASAAEHMELKQKSDVIPDDHDTGKAEIEKKPAAIRKRRARKEKEEEEWVKPVIQDDFMNLPESDKKKENDPSEEKKKLKQLKAKPAKPNVKTEASEASAEKGGQPKKRGRKKKQEEYEQLSLFSFME